MKNNKGFTLVELLAVIAILAILVIIALPNVLKMFNDSKKNSFLTEAKTVYSEVSKKYISESMKGNKLTYVNSEDDTKLDMTGKKLQYCVLLNADGSVKSMKVSNGEWIAELSGNKKITDLKSTDLKNGNLDNEECGPKKPKTFKEDSWDTIANAVRTGQTSNNHVGDEKEVDLGTYGKHNVRIANMSTPDECSQNGFSQSACGFVIEFTDIITTHNMNPKGEYKGKTYDYGWNLDGWPASQMKAFIDNDIYNSLPNELKSVIITTETVSGHGSGDTREVDLGTYGKHTLRIANMSTPSECNHEGFSQSACGFVVEFTDIITTHNMNPKGDYNGKTYNSGWSKDGWPKSQMKTFIDNDIYNSLPEELKSVIITTETVSGHGKEDTDNFTSPDKLYLLSAAEVWAQGTSDDINYDTARDKTRQLDYYNSKGVTTSSYASAIKNNSSGSAAVWWLRSPSSNTNDYFYFVHRNGICNIYIAYITFGVSPAFRIG